MVPKSLFLNVFRYSLLFFLLYALFLGSIGVVFAGFGITPPYVKNDRLTRESSYKQKITLVRSDPTEDLKTEITINVPGIEHWFSIDKGTEFILPKGKKQTPIVITVNVPGDAKYGDYQGNIRIRTSPANTLEGGGVSIALGAQIDVDINVVDKVFDFIVRRVKISDMEEGYRRWGLFFPGKVKFFMTIENTGNVSFGPTNVRFEIYDSQVENLLETTKNRNKIQKIPPFAIQEVVAELPIRLSAGRYTAKYTIFKKDEIAQQGEINVSISSLGAVLGYDGYGFLALSLKDKAKVSGVFGGIAFVFLSLFVFAIRRRRKKRAYLNQ